MLSTWKKRFTEVAVRDVFTLAGLAEGLLEKRREVPALVHLHDDVAAADELPIDEDLGEGRPARELVEVVPELLVGEDVVGGEGAAVGLHDLAGAIGESAPRKVLGALHVNDDLVLRELRLD